MHYLIEEKPQVFWSYVRNVLRGGASDMEAFVNVFGDLKTLERSWRVGLSRARTRFAIGMGEYMDRGGNVRDHGGPPSYRPFRLDSDALEP